VRKMNSIIHYFTIDAKQQSDIDDDYKMDVDREGEFAVTSLICKGSDQCRGIC